MSEVTRHDCDATDFDCVVNDNGVDNANVPVEYTRPGCGGAGVDGWMS